MVSCFVNTTISKNHNMLFFLSIPCNTLYHLSSILFSVFLFEWNMRREGVLCVYTISCFRRDHKQALPYNHQEILECINIIILLLVIITVMIECLYMYPNRSAQPIKYLPLFSNTPTVCSWNYCTNTIFTPPFILAI